MDKISVDLDEMLFTKPAPKEKGDLYAYCNSFLCNKSDNGSAFAYGTVKEVKRSVTFCPDCGSALFWSRSDGRSDKRTKNRFLRKAPIS